MLKHDQMSEFELYVLNDEIMVFLKYGYNIEFHILKITKLLIDNVDKFKNIRSAYFWTKRICRLQDNIFNNPFIGKSNNYLRKEIADQYVYDESYNICNTSIISHLISIFHDIMCCDLNLEELTKLLRIFMVFALFYQEELLIFKDALINIEDYKQSPFHRIIHIFDNIDITDNDILKLKNEYELVFQPILAI